MKQIYRENRSETIEWSNTITKNRKQKITQIYKIKMIKKRQEVFLFLIELLGYDLIHYWLETKICIFILIINTLKKNERKN